MSVFTLREGASPLIVSIPHAGTELPDDLAPGFTERARALPDTDWHLERLYDFVPELDATMITAHVSRYVIDLNRDPTEASLYPGQTTTALCPTETFDGEPLYVAGAEPDAAAIEHRRRMYFWPYHEALEAAIGTAKERHGFALLYDAHSIRSEIPRLFEGRLPVLSLGTWEGRACGPDLRAAAGAECYTSGTYDVAIDGRFKGGWITRHYGRPAEGIFALQMELAQRAYMEEAPPWRYDELRADELKRTLRRFLETVTTIAARLPRRA